MKIKNLVNTVLSYSSIIKIITGMETKLQIKQLIYQLEIFFMLFLTIKLFSHLIIPQIILTM